eukprot:scaffold58233_cov17-Tisochrysis_lutea.AAC.1
MQNSPEPWDIGEEERAPRRANPCEDVKTGKRWGGGGGKALKVKSKRTTHAVRGPTLLCL